MITGTHTIELLVEGERLDIYSQEKLNLRINNVVFDPVQVNNKTGEYSFSFNLPATPKNNRIFNYANNSSKDNKFTIMRNCDVIADGETIFSGIIRLSESSTGDYKCNLVNVKVNNIEDIFGEMKMNEISWEIPFEGTQTITTMNNNDPNQMGVYFPLVCYGIFPKIPYASYNNGDINYYTDILDIDKYNRWYWESFKPSMQLTSLVRRYFNSKGYEVSGDFFDDAVTNDIYLSTNISDEQDPYLNLGNPNIGKLTLGGYYNNFGTFTNSTYRGIAPRARQSLSFPRDQVKYETVKFDEYNFDEIYIYDILGTPFSSSEEQSYTHLNHITGSTNSYMYRNYGEKDNGGYIYIPHDGLYSIRLSITNLAYDYEAPNLDYVIRQGDYVDRREYAVIETEVSRPRNWDNCPVEFHLLRNQFETELIGTADPYSGNPPETDYMQYPHEMDYNLLNVSSRGSSNKSYPSRAGTLGTTDENGGRGAGSGTGVSRPGIGTGSGSNRGGAETPDEQYYTTLGNVVCYDAWVNPNFICGFTTLNKSAAVMKNGGSWHPECGEYNQNHFSCNGYMKRTKDGNVTWTDYHQNILVNSDQYFTEDGAGHKNGTIDVVMELKAGDCLSLFMITKVLRAETRGVVNGNRGYTMDNDYMLSFSYSITVTPYTPNSGKYIGSNYMVNKLPTEEELVSGWGKNLKLEQWLNKDEKVSDWINNVIKTFNLKYTIEGNTVSLNLGKNKDAGMAYVDLDDRVNTDNATFSRIEYPSFMEVKFSIAEDEAGAYRSIPTVQQQGAPNWKDYIERGSDKIVMDMSETTTSQTVDSKFSYNWWQTFKKTVDVTWAETGTDYELTRIPLIAKDENFIIYTEEAVAKDGLGLKQRMWYKGVYNRTFTLWNDEKVVIRLPQERRQDRDVLNFKNEDGSMIDKYFNITPMLDSNFCTVEVYLTPKEYLMLKNGASVKFDDDFYMVSEITGYDPSNNNTTTLKLIKRTK